VHLNSFESEKNVPGGHTRIRYKLKRSLKVVEHLGGEIVQRRMNFLQVQILRRRSER
jgi:hypothetical protein